MTVAIPAGFTRLSFHGTLQAGQEIWQTSLWVGVDISSQAGADAMAADAAASWVSSGLTNVLLGSADTFEGVNAYVYQSGGTVANFVGVGGTSAAGPSSAPLPLQACLVATLESNEGGRSGRGRMFLPCRRGPLGTDGLISTTVRDSILAGVVGLCNTLNARTPVTVVSVISQKLTEPFVVQSVSMDQRIDIQRRRANHQSPGVRKRTALA